MKTKRFIKILLRHYEERSDRLKEEMGKQIKETVELRTVLQESSIRQLASQQEHDELWAAYRKIQGLQNVDHLSTPLTQGIPRWSVDAISEQENKKEKE